MKDEIDLPNGPAASPDDAADGADGATNSNTDTAEDAPEFQRELEEQRDRYLRLAAEYDNYRKRSSRERQEAGSRAQGELVKSLIDSLDDLARVDEQDPEVVDARTIHQGVEVVSKKLMKALSAAGLELIDPVD
ncbi:MAG: nucleotide exchange factor GrpE, partial [Gemmatimonadales bacterium]